MTSVLDVKKRSSEEQIIGILRGADADRQIKDLCRQYDFSDALCYPWRGKFGGMSVTDAKRRKDLEAGSTRLTKLLAEQVFDKDVVKDALEIKWRPRRHAGC